MNKPRQDESAISELSESQRAFVYHELAFSQTNEIALAFQENGIALIPWKGVWFARWLYDDPVKRPMIDIDLVVLPNSFDEAGRTLENLGYFTDESIKARLGFSAPTQRGYIRPGFLPVELHRQVSSGRAAAAFTRHLFNHSTSAQTPFDQNNIRYPVPEAVLVALALHYREHGFQVLPYQIQDVRLLIEKFDLDWKLLRRFADHACCRIALLLLLEAASIKTPDILFPKGTASLRYKLVRSLTETDDTGQQPILPATASRNGNKLWRLFLHLGLGRDSLSESLASQADHLLFEIETLLKIGLNRKP